MTTQSVILAIGTFLAGSALTALISLVIIKASTDKNFDHVLNALVKSDAKLINITRLLDYSRQQQALIICVNGLEKIAKLDLATLRASTVMAEDILKEARRVARGGGEIPDEK